MRKSVMDYYLEANGMSEDAVKNEYGVSKANTLKVLKKLLIAELKDDVLGSAPAEKKVRKPRKPRKNSSRPETAQ